MVRGEHIHVGRAWLCISRHFLAPLPPSSVPWASGEMPGGDQSHPGGWVFHYLVRSASINISSLFSSWDFALFFPLGDHSVEYAYTHTHTHTYIWVEEAGYYCSLFLEGPKLSLSLLHSSVIFYFIVFLVSVCVKGPISFFHSGPGALEMGIWSP